MRDLYGVAGNALRFKVGWLGPLGRPSSVPPSLAGPHLSHPAWQALICPTQLGRPSSVPPRHLDTLSRYPSPRAYAPTR